MGVGILRVFWRGEIIVSCLDGCRMLLEDVVFKVAERSVGFFWYVSIRGWSSGLIRCNLGDGVCLLDS